MFGRLAALPLLLLVANCATITRGTEEAFTVETEPSGASVTTSIGLSCEATPCVFADVERDSEFTVTIAKPGYRTWTGTVTHQTSGGGAAGMAGNVLFGGLIGAAVDAGSGATQELVPNPLRVTLELEPAPVAPTPAVVEAPVAAAGAATEAPVAPAETTPASAAVPAAAAQ